MGFGLGFFYMYFFRVFFFRFRFCFYFYLFIYFFLVYICFRFCFLFFLLFYLSPMLLYSFNSFQINLTFCLFSLLDIYICTLRCFFFLFFFFFWFFCQFMPSYHMGVLIFYSPGAWSRDQSVAGTKSGISHILSLHLVGARGITRLVVGSISTYSAGNITRHHSMLGLQCSSNRMLVPACHR